MGKECYPFVCILAFSSLVGYYLKIPVTIGIIDFEPLFIKIKTCENLINPFVSRVQVGLEFIHVFSYIPFVFVHCTFSIPF